MSLLCLPNEMKIEILKNLEFSECLKCQLLSSHFQSLILKNQRFLRSQKVRQLFVTKQNIRVNFENSKNIWILDFDEAELYLRNSTVTVLWLELINYDFEPIKYLSSIFSFKFKIENLKLGSSKVPCDLEKLEGFMDSKNCRNLIVDKRFNISPKFLKMDTLLGLTISQTERISISIKNFKGTWLELDKNDLTTSEIIEIIKRWKSGKIPNIHQYNICLNDYLNILEQLQEICICLEYPRKFETLRNTLQQNFLIFILL
ncbi:unnamed protein product [Caenorhabditis angaria]|uniref:F-box domain-containing protein n=1 Tax=Caenorhabditis angaria TaxID=860376 RepID=A0A9P1MUP3_9PELO|nr:unnamed protein product [Caenorhabditis angaria]